MLSQTHFRNLLASFDFSEGSGTSLIDKSGNGNNATIVGGTWTADRFGRANRAVLLDGIDDYIDLDLSAYNGDMALIISLKVLETGSNYFVSKYVNASNYVRARMNYDAANKTDLNVVSSGAVINPQRFLTSPTTVLNNWNMFGFSIKNSEVQSHSLNGFQIQTLDTVSPFVTWNVGTGRLYIGKHTTSFLNCVVDRIIFQSTFKAGHELSKIANRLKIGDIAK